MSPPRWTGLRRKPPQPSTGATPGRDRATMLWPSLVTHDDRDLAPDWLVRDPIGTCRVIEAVLVRDRHLRVQIPLHQVGGQLLHPSDACHPGPEDSDLRVDQQRAD